MVTAGRTSDISVVMISAAVNSVEVVLGAGEPGGDDGPGGADFDGGGFGDGEPGGDDGFGFVVVVVGGSFSG